MIGYEGGMNGGYPARPEQEFGVIIPNVPEAVRPRAPRPLRLRLPEGTSQIRKEIGSDGNLTFRVVPYDEYKEVFDIEEQARRNPATNSNEENQL